MLGMTAGRVVAALEIPIEVRGGEEAGKRTGKRVSWVHINIAGPVAITLASGREYVYIVVDDYTRAVYAAIEAFKEFKAAAESMSLGRGSRRS